MRPSSLFPHRRIFPSSAFFPSSPASAETHASERGGREAQLLVFFFFPWTSTRVGDGSVAVVVDVCMQQKR